MLKLLRKQVDKASKTKNLLSQINIPDVPGYTLSYESEKLPDLDDCLKLFQENMADLYKNSSWGLDMGEKRAEFTHKTARFLLVRTLESELAAFVHFRFCLDDDEEPTRAVLYVYEIQVASQYRRQGLGRQLMSIVEEIAKTTCLKVIMLTVFASNGPALTFYQEKLQYEIDETSPSNYDKIVDYEILSKEIIS